MSTTRPFAYNIGSPITGTTQLGDLAIGVDNINYSQQPGGVQWWNGPDEELGYIITHTTPSGTQPNPVGIPAYLGFWRSKVKTEGSFIVIAQWVSAKHGDPQIFATGLDASTWLNNNGYWTSYNQVILTPTPTATQFILTPTPTPTEINLLIDPIIVGLDEYVEVGMDEYLMFVDSIVVTPTPTPTPTETQPEPTPTPTETQPEPTPTPTETQPEPTPTPTETQPIPTPTPTETQPIPTPTPTETQPEPTPTPTETQPIPTPTPTETQPIPTPTPTSGATGDGWSFYTPEGTLQGPPSSSGQTVFVIPSGVGPNVSTFNPNYTGSNISLYFNEYTTDGVSYNTEFQNLDTNGGTITITQNGDSVTYSGTALNFLYGTSPNNFLGVQVTNSSQLISPSAAPFVSGSPITLTFNGVPSSTPTPTPTQVTPTPTPTVTSTSTPTPTVTSTSTPTPTPTETEPLPTPTPTQTLTPTPTTPPNQIIVAAGGVNALSYSYDGDNWVNSSNGATFVSQPAPAVAS